MSPFVHKLVQGWFPSDGDLDYMQIEEGLVLFSKNFAKFFNSPSHEIFRQMHEVLNIDENKN